MIVLWFFSSLCNKLQRFPELVDTERTSPGVRPYRRRDVVRPLLQGPGSEKRAAVFGTGKKPIEILWGTWWIIPRIVSRLFHPIISGLTLLIPLISGVTTYILSGVIHQVKMEHTRSNET